MSEKKAYDALSSSARLSILRLLRKDHLNVEEIAELVNLQPISVHHHLQSLEDAGFIESYEKKSGTVGRPKVYFRITKKPKVVSYPKRRYLTLSNFVIKTLPKFIGSTKTNELLKRVGKKMGKNVIKEIESKHLDKEWSYETFEELFLNEYLEEEGTDPEIVKSGKNQVVYRMHNCLFFELAVKMPEIMCDTLHEAFHEGISIALNKKVKIKRLTCQGHGDRYCEHECEWQDSSD
jgi:predicted ArsR family transcriptional regulator